MCESLARESVCVLAFFRVLNIWAELAKQAVNGFSHSVLAWRARLGAWLRSCERVLDGGWRDEPCFSFQAKSVGRTSGRAPRIGRFGWCCISCDILQKRMCEDKAAVRYPHRVPGVRLADERTHCGTWEGSLG